LSWIPLPVRGVSAFARLVAHGAILSRR